MADDDQQAPQQRYWFPYWTGPTAPAPRSALRPQLSRRDTRPTQPQPPPVTPAPSRRQPQPAQEAATAAASRAAAGGAGPPQAQPQPTRLSSKPSSARGHPLSPIKEPNRDVLPPAPASATKETTKPQVQPATTQPEAPKELDITVPQEKIIHEPPSDTKAQSKAAEKKEHKEKEKHKKEHKEKDKDGKEKKEKEKEHKVHKEQEKDRKEHKDHKEKEKEKDHKEHKEKEHKEKKDRDKHKDDHDESKHHGGKLHKELKAGVADMVHKLGATAPPSARHHERHASGGGTTVITLAGENKGASMKISYTEAESKDNAAAKDCRANKQLQDGKHQEAFGAKGLMAFVNSNVQVVNNSLVMQSSCSSSDPGVHLKLSTKSKKKGDRREEAGGKTGSGVAAKKK